MKDDSGDVVLHSLGGEQHFSVSPPIFGGVLQLQSIELLDDGTGGLVGGEDALAWGANFLGSVDQLLSVVLLFH